MMCAGKRKGAKMLMMTIIAYIDGSNDVLKEREWEVRRGTGR